MIEHGTLSIPIQPLSLALESFNWQTPAGRWRHLWRMTVAITTGTGPDSVIVQLGLGPADVQPLQRIDTMVWWETFTTPASGTVWEVRRPHAVVPPGSLLVAYITTVGAPLRGSIRLDYIDSPEPLTTWGTST